MRSRLLTLALLLAGLTVATANGQDKPISPPSAFDQTEMLKRVVKSCYDAAAQGTEIYNKGNYEGCYRLYQGTLIAVQPLLSDRSAKLAASVKERLDSAKNMPAELAAHELRKALDEIQKEIAPSGKLTGTTETKLETKSEKVETKEKLLDRLGGPLGIESLAQNTIGRAKKDVKLERLAALKKLDDKTTKELTASLSEYISSVSGSVIPFNIKVVKPAFAGMKVTDDEFDAFKSDFEKELEKKQDLTPADVKLLTGAIETLRKEIVEVKSKN
jgi:hypothetical protein